MRYWFANNHRTRAPHSLCALALILRILLLALQEFTQNDHKEVVLGKEFDEKRFDYKVQKMRSLSLSRRSYHPLSFPYAHTLLTLTISDKHSRTFVSRCFNISLGVVRSLPWGLCNLAVKRLPQMQEVVGSNPTQSKICFSQFTLFYRMECEKLFVKLM